MGHPRPLTRPVGPIPSDGRSLIFQGSKSLFTDPAITTRPFSVLWPHLHGITNHFPIGHPSFHYSSPSTLNSGVLNGCVTEKGRWKTSRRSTRDDGPSFSPVRQRRQGKRNTVLVIGFVARRRRRIFWS
ncbi:uncharacterized protein LOC108857439 [Raphanus sativus]|uniref:Uncharacterized protein LOC108857439 n=1 Tax=Raphanus sativus TaxID=3726 RepID=A0A9W3DNX8_RAPSA|nr:uncharacterized protein LOC108857439 [Raphanus sativus]